jgi:hypothetical protein
MLAVRIKVASIARKRESPALLKPRECCPKDLEEFAACLTKICCTKGLLANRFKKRKFIIKAADGAIDCFAVQRAAKISSQPRVESIDLDSLGQDTLAKEYICKRFVRERTYLAPIWPETLHTGWCNGIVRILYIRI